ncbi:LacI family DNA-binding transcriptional regulator [Bifidobacterium bifidum]|uniref:LacI family DNA-binding transcriptional regulator n=1 Tax=Bifidobacterium bifidum TaxID=1681 RepID=UPI00232F4B9A|nr:LacI family DNA-binding transcriptional regulator [Bifidobacterium bifidum]MDB1226117.1 LacI family DNA-binding transcriptional regulator [Bifidobacterium bifidum]MDB1230159.1 LacI family DNA-binding transcriptional regulator [Bifidobacterium bifidum]MDB1231404.1 LacI family DNA-binding transcriptional regulator [Bifidobacterium bifidum]MDB1236617.1 LacI family DNA-binding transcriptional regulator [Bifidobacterium bifidum]MDB1243791.1 LacI family DNA-binding transcriptional regulator [Bifi
MTHGNAERRGEGGGGVSPSTVSYTLRGGTYVSQETPGQVCTIIERNKNTTPVDILH